MSSTQLTAYTVGALVVAVIACLLMLDGTADAIATSIGLAAGAIIALLTGGRTS